MLIILWWLLFSLELHINITAFLSWHELRMKNKNKNETSFKTIAFWLRCDFKCDAFTNSPVPMTLAIFVFRFGFVFAVLLFFFLSRADVFSIAIHPIFIELIMFILMNSIMLWFCFVIRAAEQRAKCWLFLRTRTRYLLPQKNSSHFWQ